MKLIASAIIATALLFSNPGAYAEEPQIQYEVHNPKGKTMDLVPFEHKLFDFHFSVKYPAAWYASEEYNPGRPGLYLTPIPIKNKTDTFRTGASLIYDLNFFIRMEDPSSEIGRMAKVVLAIHKWDSVKKQLLENLRKQNGVKDVAGSDITISGFPAMKVDYESGVVKMKMYYIKVGSNLLTIAFESSPSEFSEYEKLFNSMLASFSFDKDFKPEDESAIAARMTEDMMRKR